MSIRSRTLLFAVMLAAPTLFPAIAQARYTISCESQNYRYQYCPANTEGYARLVSQHSKAPCNRGSSWGYDNGGVWVDNGCSAEFEVGGGRSSNAPPPPPYSNRRAVPDWAVGTFRGTSADGHQQTITIDRDGAVTLRDRNGAVERGHFNGGVITLPNESIGVSPSGSGILVNGIYFTR